MVIDRINSDFCALINTYNYEDSLFRIDPNLHDYKELKEKYKDPIINSFIRESKTGNGKLYDTSLSNRSIESINSKVKNLKCLDCGFRNFEHFRNRFLYATKSTLFLML